MSRQKEVLANAERLYRTPKMQVHREKAFDEPLITFLPHETQRFLLMRRNIDSKSKVPVSHFRARQLKEMFAGLDHSGRGFIDLTDLKDALRYVEDHLNEKNNSTATNTGATQAPYNYSKTIMDAFKSMDANSDGVVDFQEFISTMNGCMKSAMSKISEEEIDKLRWKIIEYGELQKRNRALELINRRPLSGRLRPQSPGGSSPASPGQRQRTSSRGSFHHGSMPSAGIAGTTGTASTATATLTVAQQMQPSGGGDLEKMKQFRVLFGLEADMSEEEIATKRREFEQRIKHRTEKIVGGDYEEKVLIELQESTAGKEVQPEDRERLERVKRERDAYYERVNTDVELRAVHERIAEERKYLLDMKRVEQSYTSQGVYASSAATKLHETLVPVERSAKKEVCLKLLAIKEGYGSMHHEGQHAALPHLGTGAGGGLDSSRRANGTASMSRLQLSGQQTPTVTATTTATINSAGVHVHVRRERLASRSLTACADLSSRGTAGSSSRLAASLNSKGKSLSHSQSGPVGVHVSRSGAATFH